MCCVMKTRGQKIPRRNHDGDILWREPTTTQIAQIHRNSAYAGTFTYGRAPMRYENGLPTKRRAASV